MAEYAIIERPVGVSVFGSSVQRVRPDRVILQFTVRHTDPEPRQAYARTQADARAIAAFLSEQPYLTFGQSGSDLYPQDCHRRSESGPPTYLASTKFEVRLTDLTRLESLMTALVDFQVQQFDRTAFTTTRLREVRQQVRREAVHSARQKAALYAEEAGVQLGPLLHLQDLNPDHLRRSQGHHAEPRHDDLLLRDEMSLHPHAVTVGAAVTLVYALA
ncbi:SIMPL domain-containing protein [Deinococcus multiflagellatus]|uniref:SIMPL domain-containing protein n=1 Tax=Deinococcus multiflagellatus TaxID=1656887 RepID=A0ABW1ZK46_9DEIO|nr:SIMPL domain-containing protein [Deinococcus multiflagellatus]MBZ9713197.1 SIMPL domain-containing protein [Deinococcus multiflagellatus]